MPSLHSAMRLKVNGDTFFLPDANGGVFFRNNEGTFAMQGKSIYLWIEKLMPMFNGEHTLGTLTDQLPESYRKQVYDIAEVLYKNGFVRDISQDLPHQLVDGLLERYASQIEFLDAVSGSGGFRFQTYRESKVLLIGAGPFLVSLVSALLESGLPKFHMLITDHAPTNRQRLKELAAFALRTDPEVELQEMALPTGEVIPWQELIQPFDWILYVSQDGNVEELRTVHAACRLEKKGFLPAVGLEQIGMAGPLVHPDVSECFESAWRRVHRAALCKDKAAHPFSSTAGAILANTIVFELVKAVTGAVESDLKQKIYLLNLETLEGEAHPFFPHPRVTGLREAESIQDLEMRIQVNSAQENSDTELSFWFHTLTSAETGIFHTWEEGDLPQLPLAQCRVQVVDPLTDGPADLLPSVVGAGLTHMDARWEAGLIGIESYVSRCLELPANLSPTHQEVAATLLGVGEVVGVGAGATTAEGLSRGLRKCLLAQLRNRLQTQPPTISKVKIATVEDQDCAYYLQALGTMRGEEVTIGLGEPVHGFPVLWVGTGGSWYGAVGLNVTDAFQQALLGALIQEQNVATCNATWAIHASNVLLDAGKEQGFVVPDAEATTQADVLTSALQVVKQNGKGLMAFDLRLESCLKEGLAEVFGVVLREEESR